MPNRNPLCQDRNFIEDLKQAGVLEDLDRKEAEFLQQDGYATLLCGDCDHSHDSIAHLQDCFQTHRIHVLAVNGGAVLLDPDSPPNRMGIHAADFLRNQVYQTFELKKFRHLFLDAHVPCGVATHYRMTARDIVESLMRAKDFLIRGEDRPARLDTIYLLLRYWDGGKLRTYGFKRRNMRTFLATYGSQAEAAAPSA